jgi:hypothetical protein
MTGNDFLARIFVVLPMYAIRSPAIFLRCDSKPYIDPLVDGVG